MRRTTRAQSWTLIGGASPRRQWSSASRRAVKASGSSGCPDMVSSPLGAAAARRGIEHPWRVPGGIARRGGPMLARVDMGQGTESPLHKQLTGASDERLVALAERDCDERVLRRRLLGDATYLLAIDAHGFFHEDGIAVIQQMVSDRCHRAMPTERDHGVRSGRSQHLPVVDEDRPDTYSG